MKDLKRLLVIALCLVAASLLSAPMIAFADSHPADAAGNVTMVPFYWVVGIVGGSIAITLTYVSWRKYKAEKRKQSDKNSNS
ncbi:hypothetical protein GCM10028778_10930 [Barrientosiimonas marina]|uniref:Sporulation protein YpjB n=1 Tax=Lentibacillus kimchii TaxID=1542911 RepID=A0ABW2UWJ9_9BACI